MIDEMKLNVFETLPVFHGQTGEEFRRFENKVKWLRGACQADKLALLAPALIEKFKGEPEEKFITLRATPPAHILTADQG